MKHKTKISFYGIMSLLAFALVLGACPVDSEKSPDRSNLTLSGQVYIQNTNPVTLMLNIPNEKYTGNLEISDGDLGGTGQIKNGQLNYSIGIPLNLEPMIEADGLDYLKEMYPSLKFSSEDVNGAVVVLETTNSEEYDSLLKGLLSLDTSPSAASQTEISITIGIETVNYVYVDKDLKITANADTFNYTDFYFPISLKTEKINLSLKKGWNSLYSEITAKADIPMDLLLTLDPSGLDFSALKPTGTLKVSVGDPAKLNWSLVSSQLYDNIGPQYPDF